MSKDTIKVNMNVYDIPIVVEQLKKLEQENKQLKEEIVRLNNEIQLRIKSIEKLENDIIEYQRKIQTIKRNCKRDKAKLRNRIDKAIEYIKEKQELNKMFGNITLSEESQKELLAILGDKE